MFNKFPCYDAGELNESSTILVKRPYVYLRKNLLEEVQEYVLDVEFYTYTDKQKNKKAEKAKRLTILVFNFLPTLDFTHLQKHSLLHFQKIHKKPFIVVPQKNYLI